ncbi:MAG: trifunctional transcriptional regulator/proline dehydrogenase/L-glutamate gamma-semialdehyde dehydrogenase [Burkholderiaceae bacterium]|nr:trifunctional transcriptional regulator/proline dehydrogenase/L-glutamate gamma-semialdehyde dehydrogenase [Burkholderiaceae bacterium]
MDCRTHPTPTSGRPADPAASADAAPPPFAAFTPLPRRSASRQAITAACRLPEPQALPPLLAQARLTPAQAQAAEALATRLARGLRERSRSPWRGGLVQELLQAFSLSSQEGVALMCLAEALLRIPDDATRDALIRDKVAPGHWERHLRRGRSLFVNAAAWGLLITGRLVATHSEQGLGAALARLTARGGEPLIRRALDMAMRLMGEQFVSGRSIDEALQRAGRREAQGFRHSYDMLGEAALTAADAERYRSAYEAAIHAIGQAAGGRGPLQGPGISIKLSALHPRYSRAQQARVMDELYPRLAGLATLACRYDLGLNLDAEEADRLELSLDLFERLCHEPALAGWNGLGFVVQAYQKRCPAVIDHLIGLARATRRRLMLRLVKGAYWDSEIKRAQTEGLAGYPVYTRKAYTDVAYLACARRLLAAPDAVFAQFATHNAHSLAAIHTLADPARWRPDQYEFQCLHGMGEPLYEQVVGAAGLQRPCRIYAPVGSHESLLAYLVRRLLENGANSSFVHRVADASTPLAELVRDPVAQVDALAAREGRPGLPHPALALPADLYGRLRRNSRGLDLADEATLARLAQALPAQAAHPRQAAALLAEPPAVPRHPATAVTNPADARDTVGWVHEASEAELEAALAAAQAFAPHWAATDPGQRAALLDATADHLEAQAEALLALLVREAGKTCANAQGEIREAVDFLRFDAAQLRHGFEAAGHAPLGVVACISPWNFPLAIFTGQVAAALAAGNTVLAKPAEQTPLVAAAAVRAFHAAGLPPAALQLLPGRGETVGERLIGDARVQGVLFTGSTEVARLLQRRLAGRLDRHGQPLPLIAETGGLNAMIVDASALPEQVVADVLASAFDSAGQRCSALRLLCLQEEVAERILTMLHGALAELRLGRPDALEVDIGPVIDAEARAALEQHIDALRAQGHRVTRLALPAGLPPGHFVAPAVIEIDRVEALQREVFGPVLHVLRWRRSALPALLDAIHARGYGLTLGLHTRIDETIAAVAERARVGNLYVNRPMVAAVVGVQPFGGEGLSGTGPKAGGPLYLYRLLARRPADALGRALDFARALQGPDGAAPSGRPVAAADPPPPSPSDSPPDASRKALQALQDWAVQTGDTTLQQACARLAGQAGRLAAARAGLALAGPTGERNLWRLLPRRAVLCLAEQPQARLLQLAAVLAAGSRAVWPAEAAALRARLPAALQPEITLHADPLAAGLDVDLDAVLHQGSAASLQATCRALAQRPGPIVGVTALGEDAADLPLLPLLVERTLSLNTAAAGGNASLMMLAAQ